MKILSFMIALTCLTLILVHWGTPMAMAWAVAFAGWMPHVFSRSKEILDGHQA